MTNTAVSPKIIPRIMASTDPITVKKPLVAQAQGTSGGASLLTIRSPVGNGTPSKTPNGAMSRTVIATLTGTANPSASESTTGITTRLKTIPQTTASKAYVSVAYDTL